MVKKTYLAVFIVLLSSCSSRLPQRSASPIPSVSVAPTPSVSPSVSPLVIPSDDAASIAAALTEAERRIRSVSTRPEDMAHIAKVQQLSYRKVVAAPQLKEAVLQLLPADLRPVAEANILAGTELRALTKPVAKIPDWRIVAPPPTDELKGYYVEAEAMFAIPWRYLAAIHLVETRMGRIRGVSSAGAQGPMQFLPSTWKSYGEGDINDPRDAIFAAARYLKANGGDHDIGPALYRYNPTQRYVRAVSAYAGEIERDERAYLAYYHWQVYVRTTNGDVLLEVG
ncbi:MAG: lytic transglycosylase domain-containing protein [Actinomycetota bacterium]